MCGICGIVAAAGPVDTFLDGPVGLAARRLAIVDLESDDQPIANG